MYSEVLHYDVHNKTNPMRAREGRARRILIKTKIIIIPAPRAKRKGEDRAIIPGASTPLSPPRRVRYISLSSLAFLFPVSTPRKAARDGGRGSSGDGRPHPRLPLVVMVVAQLGVLLGCQLVRALRRPIVHPASRGSQRRCGHRVLSCVSSAGGVAMWGVLTSWLSYFPVLPDTS